METRRSLAELQAVHGTGAARQMLGMIDAQLETLHAASPLDFLPEALKAALPAPSETSQAAPLAALVGEAVDVPVPGVAVAVRDDDEIH